MKKLLRLLVRIFAGKLVKALIRSDNWCLFKDSLISSWFYIISVIKDHFDDWF
jgi:hypothetical protein